MTVRLLNSSVHSMNNKLCSLVVADLPSSLNSLRFRFCVKAGSLCIIALYIPSAIRIVDYMMFVSCHYIQTPTFDLLSVRDRNMFGHFDITMPEIELVQFLCDTIIYIPSVERVLYRNDQTELLT